MHAPVEQVKTAAYTIPTDAPESDGTLQWSSTTLVVVHVKAGGTTGLGYTYADSAATMVIDGLLGRRLAGMDAFNLPECWRALRGEIRNNGQSGLAAMAVAAVDNALWDLKAKLLNVSLLDLLGAARNEIPVYGSGGFTSYSNERLQDQLGGWAARGMAFVKMKIGREPARDPERAQAARAAIGPNVELFVDGNGAFHPKGALQMAERLCDFGVTWFEEPVDREDAEGLRIVRARAPAEMEIAGGEYGFTPGDFRRLIESQTLDVVQADATRCGTSGFLAAGALCDAAHVPLSAHCAPALHATLCCATPAARHIEYFHDHVRIEELLFDGVTRPTHGALRPDRSRPGWGLELKEAIAQRYVV